MHAWASYCTRQVRQCRICCGLLSSDSGPYGLADDGRKVPQCHAKRPIQAGSIGSGFLASSWPAVRLSKLQRRAADTDAQVHHQLCTSDLLLPHGRHVTRHVVTILTSICSDQSHPLCRDGCHHCGTKQGRTVGDHIPPNKQVWGSSKDLTVQVQKLMGTTRTKPPRIKPPGWLASPPIGTPYQLATPSCVAVTCLIHQLPVKPVLMQLMRVMAAGWDLHDTFIDSIHASMHCLQTLC